MTVKMIMIYEVYRIKLYCIKSVPSLFSKKKKKKKVNSLA